MNQQVADDDMAKSARGTASIEQPSPKAHTVRLGGAARGEGVPASAAGGLGRSPI